MHATQYFVDKVFYFCKHVSEFPKVEDAETFIETFLFADTNNISTLRLDAIHRLIHCFNTSFEGGERDD